MPTVCFNIESNVLSESYMTKTGDGYMRVFYNGSAIGIEYFDNDFNVKRSGTLDLELEYWGGFYAG